MTKIQSVRVALISDTHGCWDSLLVGALNGIQELWHAGDLGSMSDAMEAWAVKNNVRLRIVTGNIDGLPWTSQYPKNQDFEIQGIRIWMTHIGGYPGHFPPHIRSGLAERRAEKALDVFVCGHSHILRVMREANTHMICLNPGAVGTSGFHKVRTLLRFTIESGRLEKMEAVELGPRSTKEALSHLPNPYE